MCTCSWKINDNGYELFFNRDEQKTRAEALPPQQFTEHGTTFLMPLDPVGKGSWIASNEHGLSVCLLNYYQGITPNGPLMSRGLLVKQLASAKDFEEVKRIINTLDLSCMASFSLLIFEAGLSKNFGSVKGLQWDGSLLKSFSPQNPMISSSVDFENVKAKRLEAFSTAKSLFEFHCSHNKESGHLSTCMHREDAKTVSLTYISISPELKTMTYLAGSPCEAIKKAKFNEKRFIIKPQSQFTLV